MPNISVSRFYAYRGRQSRPKLSQINFECRNAFLIQISAHRTHETYEYRYIASNENVVGMAQKGHSPFWGEGGCKSNEVKQLRKWPPKTNPKILKGSFNSHLRGRFSFESRSQLAKVHKTHNWSGHPEQCRVLPASINSIFECPYSSSCWSWKHFWIHRLSLGVLQHRLHCST